MKKQKIPEEIITIFLGESLDLSSVKYFIDSWSDIDFDVPLKDLVVDFRHTIHVDSHGVASLYGMYREFFSCEINMKLINVNAELKRFLSLHNMHLKFDIL